MVAKVDTISTPWSEKVVVGQRFLHLKITFLRIIIGR
jgi:hypothetical protein